MGKISALVRLALLLLFASALPAAAQPAGSDKGQWALYAEGRPILVLTLDEDSRGRWSGALDVPDEFQMRGDPPVFSGVKGPAKRRHTNAARQRTDHLELTFTSSAAPSKPSTWRRTAADEGELLIIGAVQPLRLQRVSGTARVPDDWDPERSYPTSRTFASNREMTALFQADQAARTRPGEIDWTIVAREDEARRARTKALLDSGALNSGDDFWHAAFVFQHGGDADSYLLAHTLATVAIARGRSDATWIAAASLDRYLQKIGQKQIYGTQYRVPKGDPATQEPYDRALISDALRKVLGVPAQADQEKRRGEMGARNAAPKKQGE
jgi:hypothetical protein